MINKQEQLCIEKDGVELHLTMSDCHNIVDTIVDYMAMDIAKFLATNLNDDYKVENCHLGDIRNRIDKRFVELNKLYDALNYYREGNKIVKL